MNVSFSTTDPATAKKLLKKKGFDWLSRERKDYVIKCLEEDCQSGKERLRVQDPMMYANPKIEIYDNDVAVEIQKLPEVASDD